MNTIIKGCPSAWPELNYSEWADTAKTLHMWAQIVGKVRLKAMPWQNHSWHTTLYISPRGFSTRSMPYKDGIFEIELDFESHLLIVSSTFNDAVKISLKNLRVAQFYNRLFETMKKLGIEVEIYAHPNELEEAPHFETMTDLGTYSVQHVLNYWQAAVSVHNVFQKFRTKFIGKCSPVHLFWGAFDIAVTRFSGREAPLHPGGMPNMPLDVMQEAYSHEVSSAGFWPGADSFPEAIFYSYAYPNPADFSKEKVLPEQAFWYADLGEFVLKYDDVRKSSNPEKTLMDFLETTYLAAAKTGKWDRGLLVK
jgi:hypothetical protein